MIKVFYFIFLFFSLSLGLLAKAPPVILDKDKDYYELGLNLDLLEDPDGKLTITDVNKPKWANKFKKSTEPIPSFGVSNSYFWARWTIQNNLLQKRQWILSHKYFLQDEIEFFKKRKGEWVKIKTGDFYPFSSRDVESRYFSFNVSPQKSTVYFMRIKGQGSQFLLTLSSLKRLHTVETQENFMFGLFFGLVITMMAYNFFIFLSTKSLSYLYYVLFVSFFGITMGILMGFTQRFLFQEIPWFSNNGFFFLVSCTVLFMLLFTMSLLKLKEQTPKLYKIMRIFCFVGITGIFSALTMPLTVNFAISAINALTVPCLLGFAGFYQTKMNYRPAKYFVLAFTFLFISIIIWVLATLGKVPSNFFSRHAIIFGSAFQMIILSMGLADQFNLIQEESLRKEEELANRLQLEVDRQTQEIKKSLSDISGLLNGLRQAVFAINKEGLIIPPLSNFSQEIFKKSVEGLSIFDTLFKDLDRQSELYNKILFIIKMSIGFDVLQYDISEDLLPRKIIAKNESGDAQSLRISYSPIVDENDIIIKLMLVVEDVTEIESLEKEVLKSHEESALKVQRMQEIVSNNKRELRVFIREANLNLDFAQKSVQEIKLSEFFRATHTLKGNARIYNLSSLSNHIHMIEEDLVNLKDLDQKEIKEGLQKNYDNLYGITHIFIDLSKEIFGQDVDETVIVGDEDYLEIEKDVFFETLKDVKDDLKEKGLLGIIEKLKKIEFEDLKKSLLGLHKIVNKISFSLKKELLFEIKGDPVYLDKKETSIIKESLIHIIQNASDHGIQDKGKIEIKINNSEKHYDIMISDNGQGIDHQQIYQKALEKGLINLEETEDYKKEDSLKLIFLPGFSTKILATEFSGRGVGMDVVQTNILGLGGHIQIYSDLGKGTQFKIEIPKKVDS